MFPHACFQFVKCINAWFYPFFHSILPLLPPLACTPYKPRSNMPKNVNLTIFTKQWMLWCNSLLLCLPKCTLLCLLTCTLLCLVEIRLPRAGPIDVEAAEEKCWLHVTGYKGIHTEDVSGLLANAVSLSLIRRDDVKWCAGSESWKWCTGACSKVASWLVWDVGCI